MSKKNEETKTDKAWQATPDMAVLAIEKQAKKFYSQGRLERSQELVEKLVRMRPEVGPYHALLGVIHRRQERLVKALQSLQRAAEIDPTDRNAMVNLGETLVLAGKVPEGADVLRAVFDMGYVEGVPAAEQDQFTKRAGAQLAILQKVVQAVVDEQEGGD